MRQYGSYTDNRVAASQVTDTVRIVGLRIRVYVTVRCPSDCLSICPVVAAEE